jgi:hypothetical protein
MVSQISCAVIAAALFLAPLSFGQESQQKQPQGPPPGAEASGGFGSTTTVTHTPKPPDEPYIIEDGGISIEPIYWLNRAQPALYGGATAAAFGNLGYPGDANNSVGGEISMPAGRSNSLRFSYFRSQGTGNSTLTRDSTIFTEAYNAGDYLNASYTIQSGKISWDYLSYTWHKPAGAIRVKTLWEVQFVDIGTNVVAPFKPVVLDSNGNVIDGNTATGSKKIFLPTFGLELEQGLGRHFRWEAKISAFGLPHRSDIWDAEGSVAFRLSRFEILAGEKAYHFKTSPKGDQYFADTLSGVYVGLRYYWTGRE